MFVRELSVRVVKRNENGSLDRNELADKNCAMLHLLKITEETHFFRYKTLRLTTIQHEKHTNLKPLFSSPFSPFSLARTKKKISWRTLMKNLSVFGC